MEEKIRLPYEDNGAYINDKLNQIFIFDEAKRTLKYVWRSTAIPRTPNDVIFPQLDYANYNTDIIKDISTLDECKEILNSKSTSKLIRKKQKDIVEELANGKINIGNEAFNPVAVSLYNPLGGKLIITGNASIRFNAKSFGKFEHFSLVLPKDMGLFKVSDRDISRHGVCLNERYVIANNIINPLNEDYSDEMVEDVFENLRIVPVDEIKLPNLHINVHKNNYYDREKNVVVEEPIFEQCSTND